MNHRFIGRKRELTRLKEVRKQRSASLVVIRGRRRIGKSRLIAEFGKSAPSHMFSGLPPSSQTTAQAQLTAFSQQLCDTFDLPETQLTNWHQAFSLLAKLTTTGPHIIALDEISWMGSKEPNFLGYLKNAWDMHLSKNPQLMLVLCGSISSWIEENILSSTGFLGRVTLDLVLEELPLNTCNEFWHPREKRIASHEKFKLLSITGGVPLYLEQIRPDLPAEENIKRLCFSKGGLLVREFDNIFSDLFSKTSATYKEIVSCLVAGPKDASEICELLDKKQGGTYTKYLEDLAEAGFIKRDFTWRLNNGHESRLSRYRLSDNYVRFYLKYIAPNLSKIDRDSISDSMIAKFPSWESIMGLQFENLVCHNRELLWSVLGIPKGDILMDGPYFQKPTKRQAGCQIDYLIQTRFNTIYVCEVKFSKHPVGTKVIAEVSDKIEKIALRRGFSIRPILIHVNGVEDGVDTSDFFDKVIDFGELLA